ncbi:MAG: hypothetical protein K6C36_07620 [Clostridia bacterium]|nr:hypothetical protein [Clostridia bacterium]
MKNGKTILKTAYIVLALLICLAPFACMTFARTDENIENKRLKEFPELRTSEGLNVNFMSELGDWFEDHFAFRELLVASDGKLQGLFGVSVAEGVIKGTGGWLYYTSSAPDHQRLNVFSDRAALNAANNLRLTQQYVRSQGADFVLTIAPNKNSLYPEHMPYYYPAGSGESSAQKLAPLLKGYGVNYCDLFELFRSKDETLYLMRDSHWNGRGALMAYNAIADAAGIDHETYENAPVTRAKDEIGDLGKMAYSVFAEPEWNYHYDIGATYGYTTKTKSVEDAMIVTENAGAEGTLLMFRDSFGNTLLPFFAQNSGKAVFVKTTPYLLDLYMGIHSPDTVIAEKVERNIADFAKAPPVFPAPEASSGPVSDKTVGSFTVSVETAGYDTRFSSVSGVIETDMEYDSVFVGAGGRLFEAFTVTADDSDFGFLAYLPQDETDLTDISVWISAGGHGYPLSAAMNTQEDAK